MNAYYFMRLAHFNALPSLHEHSMCKDHFMRVIYFNVHHTLHTTNTLQWLLSTSWKCCTSMHIWPPPRLKGRGRCPRRHLHFASGGGSWERPGSALFTSWLEGTLMRSLHFMFVLYFNDPGHFMLPVHFNGGLALHDDPSL